MNTIDNLAVSLLAKPFTVLYGPSGTGKTRAAIKLAQKIDNHSKKLNFKKNTTIIEINSEGLITNLNEEEVQEIVATNIYNGNQFIAEYDDGTQTEIIIECCSSVKILDLAIEKTVRSNERTHSFTLHSNSNLPCYKVIPVASNWSDNKSLIGYVNPFGIQGETIYEITPFIELLILANHPDNNGKPFFAILDEMNLSHVEYYLSDILSLMETNQYGENQLLTRDILILIKNTLSLNYSKYNQYLLNSVEVLLHNNLGLIIPNNFFVIGTINLDETTQMLSNKVLDRAHLIKIDTDLPSKVIKSADFDSTFSDEDMYNSFTKLIEEDEIKDFIETYDALKLPTDFKYANSTSLLNLLDSLYSELKKVDQAFGYRIIQEVFIYIIKGVHFYNTSNTKLELNTLLNNAINQKVLVKLYGNRRTLPQLCENIKEQLDSQIFFEVFEKLDSLLSRLELRGQATFIS